MTEQQQPQAPIFQPSSALLSLKTLTGIKAAEIPIWIDRPYPKGAYKDITARDGSDAWTDLDPYYVRNRLDKVFGPQGLGWRVVPTEAGRIVYGGRETRKSQKGEYTVYIVSLEMYCLEYALVRADSDIIYVRGSAVSTSQENGSLDYAYAGALTGCVKQSVKLLGGFNHFVMA